MRRVPEPELREEALEDGWTARVGKSARDNDLLTFELAFPRDWWLHVKGCPGSHVVLHHPDADAPPRAVLEAAARLAVRHSKARNAPKAAVSIARIQDIAKPKRAPAGQVILRKSKTLNVRME